jgi:hypothetical protein
MALYLISTRNKEKIFTFLMTKYQKLFINEIATGFSDAKALVLETCNDQTLVQPAVKILSFHDAQRLSYWLGTELHTNWDVVEFISADLMKSKFLFYPDGDNRCDTWMLIDLAPL